jgi:hypothetical protein
VPRLLVVPIEVVEELRVSVVIVACSLRLRSRLPEGGIRMFLEGDIFCLGRIIPFVFVVAPGPVEVGSLSGPVLGSRWWGRWLWFAGRTARCRR